MTNGKFKGLLSKDSEKMWGKIIDKLKKWNNRWVEWFDAPAGTQIARQLDNWLGDKPKNQEVLEPLANELTEKVYELVVNENPAAREEVIRIAKEFLREAVPLEKWLGQEGEDQILNFIEILINEWLTV